MNGAGGRLLVGTAGTAVEGWVVFDYTAGSSISGLEATDPANAVSYAAAAPFMTVEWDAALIEPWALDVADRIASCTTCDAADFDRLRDLYGPDRTIRTHTGRVILQNPKRVRVILTHSTGAEAAVNERRAPIAIANAQDFSEPTFADVLKLASVERSGTAVVLDFDILDARQDPIAPLYRATWIQDSTGLWGRD